MVFFGNAQYALHILKIVDLLFYSKTKDQRFLIFFFSNGVTQKDSEKWKKKSTNIGFLAQLFS